MIIDSHHHLWDTHGYPWMADEWADPLRGCFDAARLAPILTKAGVERTIIVEALPDESETRHLLALEADFIAGVVGWVDLTARDVAASLTALRELPGNLVGVRHHVQDESDPSWLSRPDVRRGLEAVRDAGLAYDLLIKAPQYEATLALVRSLPDVSFVVNHAAKPDIAGRKWEPWATLMRDLAVCPNVSVKLSGLVTLASWTSWSAAELTPYLRHALDCFGPERAMYGSDWPVCTLAAGYQDVLSVLLDALDEAERAAVLGETAARIYDLALVADQ